MKILPPDICPKWEDNSSSMKASILMFDKIRHQEEMEIQILLAGGEIK